MYDKEKNSVTIFFSISKTFQVVFENPRMMKSETLDRKL